MIQEVVEERPTDIYSAIEAANDKYDLESVTWMAIVFILHNLCLVINDSRYVASIQQDFSEDPPYSPPNSGFKVQNLRNKQQNQVSSSLSSYMLSKQKSDGRLSAISTSGGPLSWLRSTSCWSTDGLHKS